MEGAPQLTVRTGAWEAIWKWTWFAKEQWQADFRKRREGTRRALAWLLPKLGVRSVLDCSCGLGLKTILLAEMGYDAEGSDGCGPAVRRARQLAREQGLDIRFFRARWEKLGQVSRRKYDCIYNDAFAWITRRRALVASAGGICAALKRGGKFVFQGAHQWSGPDDRDRLIREQFQREGPFEALGLYEKNGIRLTTIIARHKRPDGVMGSRIHVIDDHGAVRVEVASVRDACIWSWTDYTEALRRAGFRRLYSVKAKGVGRRPYILNVAEK